MEDVLCDISAFRFYRVPPQVQMLMPMLPTPELDRNRYQLAHHPLVSEVLGCPVHLMRDDRKHANSGRRVIRHVWSGTLPLASITDSVLGIEVASPLFTLLTMAPSVSECRLIMAMFELCGTFCVFEPSPWIESLLERAYAERMLEPSFGWRRMVDAAGRNTNLWERPPLIEFEQLKAFSCEIEGMRGAKSFAKAAEAVTGITASPLEVQASMLLGMSKRRGGSGFALENNVALALSRGARLISGRPKRIADIVLTSKGGDQSVIIECQGQAFHSSVEARIADSDRMTALQSMGHQVIQVTYAQMCDPEKYEVLVKLIERVLGMEHREKTALQKEREQAMRREIFVPWESF